ncbi:hypothetical protein [Streptomyces sp. SBT349]|uniref:hypothetical protein n=1 Tax=Streptomyces sp. SBT349 TaxID=1580539 RepID=UPI00069FD913|nr:hypothetical protein [Streptomyces sp. SBT349]
MTDEKVLLESRTLRDDLAERTDALDKVKGLAMLPDGVHVTTEAVAAYFVVHREVIAKLTQRHRDELVANGLRVLRGSDLRVFEMDNLSFSKKSYPQGRAHLTLYSRRTVLNVAMLLRDSDVARLVRTYLLDAESRLPRQREGMERAIVDIGEVLQELGPVIHRMSVRLEHVENRVDNTERIVCAMSERLAALP